MGQSSPSDEKLSRLRQAGAELHDVETEILDVEEKLKKLRDRRNEITTRTMPEIFDEAKTDHVGLPDLGIDLVLQPFYHASLSKTDPEKQQRGFDWLEENGHGDLIKATVSVEFTKKELERARELATKIEELLGGERLVHVDLSVHWQTLTAFVREQIEKYQAALPLDLLGATVGRVVKIQQRKE